MSIFGKILGGIGTILGGPIGGAVASAVGGAIDNKRAKKAARADEARLRANSYTDFVRLRDDAVKAGFNPLTALQATGAAAYDMRGSVVATPFTPFFRDAAEFGASAFAQKRDSDRNFALESRRVDLLERELNEAGKFSGTINGPGTPFKAGAVRSVQGPSLPTDYVRVDSMTGWEYLKPGAAKAIGLNWGDWLTEGMRTDLLGEVVGEYESVTQAPFADGPFMRTPRKKLPEGTKNKFRNEFGLGAISP